MGRIPTGYRIPGSTWEPEQLKRFITQAELRALSGTALELLPAPDDGELIIVDYVYTERAGSLTAYASSISIRLRYGASGTNYAGTISSASAGAAASKLIYGTSLLASAAAQVGVGIQLSCTTTLGASGTGGLALVVGYHVVGGLAA